MKNGKYVYKDEAAMKKMHEFYNKTLASLDVSYAEENFDTTFGKTHCIIAGDTSKPMICTIHGGNGITTLNLKLFKPLLSRYCILTPDVIGMPGKSEPYRNISSGRDEYGKWIREVLEHYGIMKIPWLRCAGKRWSFLRTTIRLFYVTETFERRIRKCLRYIRKRKELTSKTT